jgi:hypothetical protein
MRAVLPGEVLIEQGDTSVSRKMNSTGKIAKGTRLDKSLVEMVVNDPISQRLMVITEKKGFFGCRKERNND